jgi:hypothetical protein
MIRPGPRAPAGRPEHQVEDSFARVTIFPGWPTAAPSFSLQPEIHFTSLQVPMSAGPAGARFTFRRGKCQPYLSFNVYL